MWEILNVNDKRWGIELYPTEQAARDELAQFWRGYAGVRLDRFTIRETDATGPTGYYVTMKRDTRTHRPVKVGDVWKVERIASGNRVGSFDTRDEAQAAINESMRADMTGRADPMHY